MRTYFYLYKSQKKLKTYANNKLKVWQIEYLASFRQFFFLSLCRREEFLKLQIACFCELKMAATTEEFITHGYDIQTYICLLLSHLKRT